jgi:ParB/RepB/Spo0J family partition protein
MRGRETTMNQQAGRLSYAETCAEPVSVPGHRASRKPSVQNVPVDRIRSEEGLGRKRDRDGHRDLRKSIEQFGVLTPVTVRLAPDGSGDYLLIKGQGRTLACHMLGLKKIPAIVLDADVAEEDKVGQFLVENVARLKMRPIDRALLISRARAQGEETVDVARRFGVTAATVRRLESQLEGASKHEVAALKRGNVNLALHAVISRHVDNSERGDIISVIAQYSLRTREVEELFKALGWDNIVALGAEHRTARLLLVAWACNELSQMGPDSVEARMHKLARSIPLTLGDGSAPKAVQAQ